MLSFVILAFVPLAAVNAFEYRVGVGKSENTGKNGLGFDPSSIRPVSGDTIVFEFHAGTHSVFQTSFDTPCIPGNGMYSSGDFTVPDGTDVEASGPTSTFTVASSDPLWFYDGGAGQCGQGGVFTVNPPLTGAQTADAYLQASKATGSGTVTSTSVSASVSASHSSVSSQTSTISQSSSTSGSSTSTSTTSAASSSTSNNSASVKTWSGIVGVVAAILGVVGGAL